MSGVQNGETVKVSATSLVSATTSNPRKRMCPPSASPRAASSKLEVASSTVTVAQPKKKKIEGARKKMETQKQKKVGKKPSATPKLKKGVPVRETKGTPEEPVARGAVDAEAEEAEEDEEDEEVADAKQASKRLKTTSQLGHSHGEAAAAIATGGRDKEKGGGGAKEDNKKRATKDTLPSTAEPKTAAFKKRNKKLARQLVDVFVYKAATALAPVSTAPGSLVSSDSPRATVLALRRQLASVVAENATQMETSNQKATAIALDLKTRLTEALDNIRALEAKLANKTEALSTMTATVWSYKEQLLVQGDVQAQTFLSHAPPSSFSSSSSSSSISAPAPSKLPVDEPLTSLSNVRPELPRTTHPPPPTFASSDASSQPTAVSHPSPPSIAPVRVAQTPAPEAPPSSTTMCRATPITAVRPFVRRVIPKSEPIAPLTPPVMPSILTSAQQPLSQVVTRASDPSFSSRPDASGPTTSAAKTTPPPSPSGSTLGNTSTRATDAFFADLAPLPSPSSQS